MKAAIFDMDGTVLDSMGMWHPVMVEFLLEMDIMPDEKFVKDTESMSLDQMVTYVANRFNTEHTEEEIRTHWKEVVYNKYINEVPPKAGIEKLLKRLKDEGFKISLATLTDHSLCNRVIEAKGLSPYFDFIMTTEDVNMVGKEHPDLFLKCASLMGAEPCETVVFEDSYYPLPAAKKAGFKICVINEPAKKKDEEKLREISDRYIMSFNELL